MQGRTIANESHIYDRGYTIRTIETSESDHLQSTRRMILYNAATWPSVLVTGVQACFAKQASMIHCSSGNQASPHHSPYNLTLVYISLIEGTSEFEMIILHEFDGSSVKDARSGFGYDTFPTIYEAGEVRLDS